MLLGDQKLPLGEGPQHHWASTSRAFVHIYKVNWLKNKIHLMAVRAFLFSFSYLNILSEFLMI